MNRIKQILPIIVLISGAVLLTAPFLKPGSSLFACHTDCFEPWAGEASDPEIQRAADSANFLLTDKLYMFHPEVMLSRDELKNGSLPGWNPYVLGGLPHLATGIPSVFSPVMFFHSFMNPFSAYGAAALFQILMAGIFFYLFLRAIGLSKQGSLFGAAAFAFSGWMAARLEYYQIAGAASFAPICLFSIEMFLKTGKGRFAVLLALGAGFSFLSGFPQIAVEIQYLTAGWAMARTPGLISALGAKGALKRLAFGAVACFAGLLISSPQMAPSAYLTLSGASTRDLASIDMIRSRALSPYALVSFLLPSALGHPFLPELAQSALNPYRTLLGESWFGFKSNFNEITVFMGVLPVCMILGSPLILRNRKVVIFLILALLGILASCNTVILTLTYYLPGLNIGDPKRFLFITVLALSGAAAFAFEDHKKRTESSRPAWGPCICAGLFACIASVLALIIKDNAGYEEYIVTRLANLFKVTVTEATDFLGADALSNATKHASHVLWSLVGWCAAASLILFISRLRKTPTLIKGGILIVFLIGELSFFGYNTNRPMTSQGFNRQTPLASFLSDRSKEEGLCRIVRFCDADVGRKACYPPKLPMLSKIDDVQGYVAIYLKRYRNLIDAIEKGLTESVGMRSFKKESSLESPLFNLLGAKYILSSKVLTKEIKSIEKVGEFGHMTLLHNKEALPRAFIVQKVKCVKSGEESLKMISDPEFKPDLEAVVEGDVDSSKWTQNSEPPYVKIKSRENSDVEIDIVSGGGLLVFTENNYNGWEAELDGEATTIFYTDHAFRGINAPPGAHKVIFRYRPKTITGGFLLCLAGLILISFVAFKLKNQ